MKRRSFFSLIAKALGFSVAAPLLPAVPVLHTLKLYDIDIRAITWKNMIADMIAERRSDPFAIHAMPFPVTHTELEVLK